MRRDTGYERNFAGAPVIPQLLAKDGELAAWMIGELRALGYTTLYFSGCSEMHIITQRRISSRIQKSMMLHYRFLYNTGASPIRSDKLITISCPTSYHKDFRFVVVGVARDDDKKLTAAFYTALRYFRS